MSQYRTDSMNIKTRSFTSWGCYILVLSVFYISFSFPGVVNLPYSDVRFLGEGKTIKDDDGVSYSFKANISHGWPWVFLERKARFVGEDCPPASFDSYPPWATAALWNPQRGHNQYEFDASCALMDLASLCCWISLGCWLAGVFRRSKTSGLFTIKDLLFLFVLLAICLVPIAEHRRCKSFESRCQALGARLFQPDYSTTLLRFLGRENVPGRYSHFTGVNARDLSDDDFRSLLKASNLRVTSIYAPVCTDVDDEFVSLVSSNFDLNSLTLDRPNFKTTDLSRLSSIELITFHEVHLPEQRWIRSQFKELETTLYFIGYGLKKGTRDR